MKTNKNLKVLSVTQSVLEAMGILPVEGHKGGAFHQSMRVFYYLALIFTVSTVITYLIVHFTDVSKATESLYLCTGYFIGIGNYSCFIRDSHKLRQLFRRIEDLINSRKNTLTIYTF